VGRISAEECDELLRTFEHGWFRLEGRDGYAIGEERPEFDSFLAGAPRPPSEVSWWAQWLDQAAALGLPSSSDWSLLDGQRVIIHEFNDAGEVTGWNLITDPGSVSQYARWQDAAVRNAAAVAPHGRAP